MAFKAFICGCEGTELTDEEVKFFATHKPCGFIIFTRNHDNPEQLKKLVQSVRDAVGEGELFVLVDQEGGRVARLRPPHWTEFPSGRTLGDIYRANPETGLDIIRKISHLLASELKPVGINVNCVPVLDIPVPGAHDIIGDRAYGDNAEDIIAVSKAVIAGHLDGGVLPVIKHIPGHGRAGADSHLELPVIEEPLEVLRKSDFVTFKAFRDISLGMTGHLLLPDLDKEHPVSTSKSIISKVIREELGFDGVLMSDDLGMEALEGTMDQRAAATLEAGCDLALHCNGELDEMKAVASVSPWLEGDSLRRVSTALEQIGEPKSLDQAQTRVWMKDIVAEYS